MHIDIRYFWLDISVMYCPTELMVADFFTKPLQGKLFQRLKRVIMGQIDIDEFIASMSDVPKERVGNNEQNLVSGTNRQTDNDVPGRKKVSWADVVTHGSKPSKQRDD